MNTQRAQKRLQNLWDELYPSEPMVIQKEILKPRSRNTVGWRWTATSPNHVRVDIGYTEKQAAQHIRRWNDPMVKAVRELLIKMEKLAWMGNPYSG